MNCNLLTQKVLTIWKCSASTYAWVEMSIFIMVGFILQPQGMHSQSSQTLYCTSGLAFIYLFVRSTEDDSIQWCNWAVHSAVFSHLWSTLADGVYMRPLFHKLQQLMPMYLPISSRCHHFLKALCIPGNPSSSTLKWMRRWTASWVRQ